MSLEPIEYPYSVSHFRAWMDSFLAINKEEFNISTRKYNIRPSVTGTATTTRAVWNVEPFEETYYDPIVGRKVARGYDKKIFAIILATEKQPNVTTIQFLDGQCYQRDYYPLIGKPRSEMNISNAHLEIGNPIGDDFIKIAEWITNELSRTTKQGDPKDAGKSEKERGKSGRPSFAEDIWAWEQVNTLERTKVDVYSEWTEKIKANPKRKNNIDLERQFNRITNPNWGKTKKTK
jgi:hypothetical protein